MVEDKIVRLEDGREYCVLNEITYNGKRYCCALEYFSDKEDVGEDYFVCEQNVDGESLVLNLVEDSELESAILNEIAKLNDIQELEVL